MQLFYRLLADLVVTIHFAYVAFVISGLVLTLVGGASAGIGFATSGFA